ncbi:MAG: hypothetical protein ACI8UO_001917 [Verrucomicrobiales bacterium]|jgi:hypothetical protein
MKDGASYTGYVEPGADAGMIKLRVITGQLVELDASEVAEQKASEEQSIMPAGLIATPAEMRDMIACLQLPKERQSRNLVPKKKKRPKTQPGNRRAVPGISATFPSLCRCVPSCYSRVSSIVGKEISQQMPELTTLVF